MHQPAFTMVKTDKNLPTYQIQLLHKKSYVEKCEDARELNSYNGTEAVEGRDNLKHIREKL